MGSNQGYMRLINGYTKTLNSSEKKRGWLFITKDKKGIELIKPSAEVRFNGKIKVFPVDNYGRLLTGREYVSTLPDTFNICFKDDVLEITK